MHLKYHCQTYHVYAHRVDIVRDPKSGQPTGQAVVELEDNRPWQLQEAVRNLAGTILEQRPISCFAAALGDNASKTFNIGFNCGGENWLGGDRHQIIRERSRSSGGGEGSSNRRQVQDQQGCGGRRARSRSAGTGSKRGLGDGRWQGWDSAAAESPYFVPPPPPPSMTALRATAADKAGTVPPPEARSARRLFVEDVAASVDWRALKRLVVGQNYDVVYAGVLHIKGQGYGMIEFKTRADAMDACLRLNGALLDGLPIRLRQDRSEFDELRENACHSAANRKRSDATEDVCRAAVRPLPAGWGGVCDDAGPDYVKGAGDEYAKEVSGCERTNGRQCDVQCRVLSCLSSAIDKAGASDRSLVRDNSLTGVCRTSIDQTHRCHANCWLLSGHLWTAAITNQRAHAIDVIV